MTKKRKSTLVFASTLFFLMAGCATDELPTQGHSSKNNQTISFEKFKDETILKKIKLVFSLSNNNALCKAITLNDFVVDTTEITKKIASNSKVTYAFRVHLADSVAPTNLIYNLVYRKSNTLWQTSIIEFEKNTNNLPEHEFDLLNPKRLYDSKLEANHMLATNYEKVCIETFLERTCTCVDKDHCDLCPICIHMSWQIVSCGGSSGGSIGTPGNSGGGPPIIGSGDAAPYDLLDDPFEFTPNMSEAPVLPPTAPDPCKDLKDMSKPDVMNMKPAVDWLKTKVNEPLEYAVEVEQRIDISGDTIYPRTEKEPVAALNAETNTGHYIIGSAHNHPYKKSYAIPSFGDVMWLKMCYDRATTKRKQFSFALIVAKDVAGVMNIYALKVKNITDLRTKINGVWNDLKYASLNDDDRLKKINADLGILYKKSNGALEKAFLEEFAGAGVDLYKAANDNLDQWDKLELSPTLPGTVIKKPCN